MNVADFNKLLETIQQLEVEVRAAGQAEYARNPDNVFANFERAAAELGLTREQVLLVYALKHWDGILSWVGGHRSQREDVRGRIKDLRMYLALLWAMVEETNTQDEQQTGPRSQLRLPIELNCPLRTGSGPCECDLPRCPECGYTKHDSQFQADHYLCVGTIPG